MQNTWFLINLLMSVFALRFFVYTLLNHSVSFHLLKKARFEIETKDVDLKGNNLDSRIERLKSYGVIQEIGDKFCLISILQRLVTFFLSLQRLLHQNHSKMSEIIQRFEASR
jgi:hypothetical protein